MTATTATPLKPRRKSEAATPKPNRPTRANRAMKPAKPPKAQAEIPAAAPKAPSKIDQVVALLRREEGATTKALMEATGWQAHSVRGIIAGAIKKKLGLTVTSWAGEGGRTYRVVTPEASA